MTLRSPGQSIGRAKEEGHWQAHRIQCEGNIDDCLQEGPIIKFKVG
jgi:hypothetical protein